MKNSLFTFFMIGFFLCGCTLVRLNTESTAIATNDEQTASITAVITQQNTPTPTITPTPQIQKINKSNWNQITELYQVGDGEIANVLYSRDQKKILIVFRHAVVFYNKNYSNLEWEETSKIQFTEALTNGSLSPDGKYLAVGLMSAPNLVVKIIDISSRGLATTIESDGYAATNVSFSNDGTKLITLSWNEINYWNTNDWSFIGQSDIQGEVYVQSPDDQYAAVWENSKLSIYDISVDPEKLVFSDKIALQSYEVPSLAFRPDGKQLVVGSNDGQLTFIDMFLFKKEKSWKAHNCENSIPEILYNPDGTILTVNCAGSLETWNLKTGTVFWNNEVDEKVRSSIVPGILPNTFLLINKEDGSASVEEVYASSGIELVTHTFNSLPWCFDQSSRYDFIQFLHFNWDKNLILLPHYSFFDQWVDPENKIYADDRVLSPNGKLAAYTRRDVKNETQEFLLRKNEEESYIILTKPTNFVWLSQKIEEIEYGPITAIVFNADSTLVTAVFHLHILTWDTQSGDLISDISIVDELGSYIPTYYFINDVVYTEDDLLIGVGDNDGKLFFADTRKGTLLGTKESKNDNGHYLSLSSDGSKLIVSTCGIIGRGSTEYSDKFMLVYGIPSH